MYRVYSERPQGGTETTESAGVRFKATADRAIEALHGVVRQQLDFQLYWTARDAHGSYPNGHTWPDGDGRLQLSGQKSELYCEG